MRLPLLISAEAESDLRDAKAWYDGQRHGLGDELLLCVEEAFERLHRGPLVAAEILRGVRRISVRRFPYGVFYKVEADQIAIIAIYHTRRNPKGWQSRA